MIDIKQHIGTILYERDSLIIPDLGGFVSKYQPATIDHVQGLIHPPSKKLQFNKNLVINDGILLAYLQEKLGLNLKEAKKTIKDFVDRTQEMLDNREIVLFPGVGRLYKDYENNLQFLQDNTNYNTKAFGLPTLQFYPILRTRSSTTGQLASDNELVQPSAAKAFNYRRVANAIIPIALIAIITLGALFYANRQQNSIPPEAQTLPVAENRINQKPGQTGEQMSIMEGITKSFDESLHAQNPDATVQGETLFDGTFSEETNIVTPELKECVIIIGAYSKKAGVEKRVKEIVDLGYSVYQDRKGKLTRVGIQFSYQHDIEIREKLEAMRDNFDNRAWILSE